MNAVSLFAGIEGIGLALERAGIPVVVAVEIDKDCRAIIARHFPDVTLFDDVTKVTGDDLIAAGFVPGDGLLAAGWPCQDNSVAGSRKGMAGARSGLWRHVVRLVAETRAAWFLGENVPGLLSVNAGRDFARCVGDLAGLGMGFAWRVLDAQHFGVPQRRRRVFLVGRAGGDATGPVQVLFEPESGDGDSAAGGEAWPGTAAASDGGIVGTLATTSGGWRVGADEAAAGQLIPALTASMGTNHGQPGNGGKDEMALAVAAALTTSNHYGDQIGAESHLIPWVMPLANRGREGGAQLEAGRPGDPAFTLRAGDGGSSRQPLIAHALTAEGFDASEDGTGRGTPLVVAAPLTSGSATGPGVNKPGRRQEDDINLVAFAVAGDFSAGDVAQTVRAANGQPGCVAWQGGSAQDQVISDDGVSPTLAHSSAAHSGHHQPKLMQGAAVRRLTPLECERLQGFPDGWTAGQSDSTRYRQLGNAVAVPCVEWIARRIAKVAAA